MNKSTQKVHVAYCILIMLLCTYASSANTVEPDKFFNKSKIKSRVERLDCFVRTKYNADIEKHIKGFVLLARNNSKRILGDATIYFPTIERKIKELGLPDDLKYLTVVESMLDPRAESYVGAKGMWQLMPFIAEDFKLSMNGHIDERYHVEKSAEAGLLYLQRLHARFGNWELALAAYNCGPNRLRKLLRTTGKNSYWAVRHLLPRQTREFVPKLIAVKYLFKYYQHHNIKPAFPAIDLQITNAISINPNRSYSELGELLGVNTEIITTLNPSLIYDPATSGLNEVEIILPARVIQALDTHRTISEIEDKLHVDFDCDYSNKSKNYHKVYLEIEEPTTLRDFCYKNNLSITQVWLWNNLSSEYLMPGQELFVYDYQSLKFKYQLNKSVEEISPIELTPVVSISDQKLNRRGINVLSYFPIHLDHISLSFARY